MRSPFNSKFTNNNHKLKVRNMWNERCDSSEFRHVVITELEEEQGIIKSDG